MNSAFVRALYDLAFAYEDGDPARPRIAAGQALRGAVRAFFTYRGAFFWKMTAGMGDVVFAPLWEVLRRRGVRFEFFHRLENVRIGEGAPGERPHVEALEIDLQAQVRGDGEYLPLVDIRGLPCWPSEPDWSQLVDGERLRQEPRDFESHWDRDKVGQKTLRVGIDFDLVVLGVWCGGDPSRLQGDPRPCARWRTMVERVKSVSTQAFQLWMTKDMGELGWKEGPVNISGFVEPFDTWADMSHLASEESFSEDVRAIAYFCSVLPDPGSEADVSRTSYPDERRAEVKRNAIRFLDRDVVHLWPEAHRGGRFRWDLVAAPAPAPEATGAARFDGQYWRANVSPTERYSLSLPGSLRYRISPLDHSYDNLTIAGDWTDCGFNEGCVEAAVMSGRLAAHAISQSPALEDIAGFDHP